MQFRSPLVFSLSTITALANPLPTPEDRISDVLPDGITPDDIPGYKPGLPIIIHSKPLEGTHLSIIKRQVCSPGQCVNGTRCWLGCSVGCGGVCLLQCFPCDV